ncbi:aromatic acid exporter family protein [Sutcliffiella deserti]|uniref:aromatic acid exporter family protein n=1 Tax=Sutcliffiella deserti TaxID=2875501 RepID=UPI001CBEC69C|nr:aromatic acid exporter family protein [Sutcliffiella deserti]
MNFLKKYKHFIGGRILKTGIAVFITAVICEWLGWPAMFAAIAAIVTIEPTAANSIKKAFIRFPASAIGALYAILFYAGLGDNPLTYALVAFATIVTCHKLHLDDGILVATLTGVAMISTVQDHYVSSFFVRLGSTSIGLTVSTLVNLFVLKPNYSPTILKKLHDLLEETGGLIERRGLEIIKVKSDTNSQQTRIVFHKLVRNVDRIEELCRYQREEWKYHKMNRQEMRLFHYESKKLKILKQLTYHVGNLIFFPNHKITIEDNSATLISSTIRSMNAILHSKEYKMDNKHHDLVDKVFDQFWYAKPKLTTPSEQHHHHLLSPETMLFYELMAINDLLEELAKIQILEQKHHNKINAIATTNTERREKDNERG